MKLLPLFSLACLSVCPAFATEDGFPKIPHVPQKPYLEEASNYLSMCPPSENRKECLDMQEEFEQEYVNAYAGDYLAQTNVAYLLWKAPHGGFIRNVAQACAWRLVISTSASPYISDIDASKTKAICSEVDQANLQAVVSRGKAIRSVISSHRVKPIPVPMINYDPKKDKDETSAF
ncbi:hypothetical protein [Asaia bogorensis]|uniref:hypothetical protein n=1 Tax=Asaia bogorensis TaxID=91915 RepID=UPI000EFBD78C|nr:hypothetical protein [Asaia bogorensis]